MKIINGKQIANQILEKLKSRISENQLAPRLGIIQVGNDEATNIYVKHKVRDAEKIGMSAEVFFFDASEGGSEIDKFKEIENLILALNKREDLHGFIIQLPLPLDGDIKRLFNMIDPSKDVDGMNPLSLGSIWQGRTDIGFLPATVAGIMECIKHVAIYADEEYESIELDHDFVKEELDRFLLGKNIVIVNDSLIVGKPLAGVLLNHGGTISICHKNTKNLFQYTKDADIIISATGVPGLIQANMVKEGTVLMDVGIKRTEQGIVGDIDFEDVKNMDGWITPVPGGVGPLTRAMLLQNTFESYKRSLR